MLSFFCFLKREALYLQRQATIFREKSLTNLHYIKNLSFNTILFKEQWNNTTFATVQILDCRRKHSCESNDIYSIYGNLFQKVYIDHSIVIQFWVSITSIYYVTIHYLQSCSGYLDVLDKAHFKLILLKCRLLISFHTKRSRVSKKEHFQMVVAFGLSSETKNNIKTLKYDFFSALETIISARVLVLKWIPGRSRKSK